MKELDRPLRSAAAHSMRDVSLVRKSLLEVKKNPWDFVERVNIFNDVSFDVSSSTVLRDFKAKEMPNLSALRKLYLKVDYEPTNLSDMVFSYWYSIQKDPNDRFIVETNASVQDLKNRLVSGELKFHPDIFSTPNTFLTRLLVEGFALDLEKFYKLPYTANKYKKALTEMLLKKYPDSVLTDDVLWWEKLESDQARCVSLKEYEEQQKERQADPLKAAADGLNKSFREDTSADEVLDDIRKFPNPILVDFNNVIANNAWPLRLNPDAPAFLEALREIGNIFIVTSASGWKVLHGFMVEQGVWHPDIVLMTSPTYEFISSWDEDIDTDGGKLRQEYIKLMEKLGLHLTHDKLNRAPGFKRVAPIFSKPWSIPFIDNDYEITHDNPGIFGIHVQEWISEEEKQEIDVKWLNERNQGKPDLMQAVEVVREYYSNTTIKK